MFCDINSRRRDLKCFKSLESLFPLALFKLSYHLWHIIPPDNKLFLYLVKARLSEAREYNENNSKHKQKINKMKTKRGKSFSVCLKGEKKNRWKYQLKVRHRGSWIKVGQDQNAKDREDIYDEGGKRERNKKAFH